MPKPHPSPAGVRQPARRGGAGNPTYGASDGKQVEIAIWREIGAGSVASPKDARSTGSAAGIEQFAESPEVGSIRPMTELWTSARRQVHKAQIVLDRAGTAVKCEVRNASRAGAMLRLNRIAEIPSAFALEMHTGGKLWCSVIRRSRLEMSVRFEFA